MSYRGWTQWDEWDEWDEEPHSDYCLCDRCKLEHGEVSVDELDPCGQLTSDESP